MRVDDDELVFAEQQRVEAGVGIALPQLAHGAPDRLGEIRRGAAVLADQAEVALAVGGAAQRGGDIGFEQAVERGHRLDGAVVRHGEAVGDEGMRVLRLHRESACRPTQMSDGGDRPPVVGGGEERGVVECRARRHLGRRQLAGFADRRDTPAVAVHLGQRDEILQHGVADGVSDGDRCCGDDTQQPAHQGILRSGIL